MIAMIPLLLITIMRKTIRLHLLPNPLRERVNNRLREEANIWNQGLIGASVETTELIQTQLPQLIIFIVPNQQVLMIQGIALPDRLLAIVRGAVPMQCNNLMDPHVMIVSDMFSICSGLEDLRQDAIMLLGTRCDR